MCLFFGLLLFGPRLAGVLWWIFEPVRWDATFDGVIVPILGLVFLPWTTVMYVVVAPRGVNGFDLVWLGLAVLADVLSYLGGGLFGRRRTRA